MRVLDPIKSQIEPVLPALRRRQKILNPEEPSLPNDRQNALMGVRSSQPG
jgi:hypothetical protein